MQCYHYVSRQSAKKKIISLKGHTGGQRDNLRNDVKKQAWWDVPVISVLGGQRQEHAWGLQTSDPCEINNLHVQ